MDIALDKLNDLPATTWQQVLEWTERWKRRASAQLALLHLHTQCAHDVVRAPCHAAMLLQLLLLLLNYFNEMTLQLNTRRTSNYTGAGQTPYFMGQEQALNFFLLQFPTEMWTAYLLPCSCLVQIKYFSENSTTLTFDNTIHRLSWLLRL